MSHPKKCEFVAALPLEYNLLGQKANACEDDGRLGGPVTLGALHPGVPAPAISATMTMAMTMTERQRQRHKQ